MVLKISFLQYPLMINLNICNVTVDMLFLEGPIYLTNRSCQSIKEFLVRTNSFQITSTVDFGKNTFLVLGGSGQGKKIHIVLIWKISFCSSQMLFTECQNQFAFKIYRIVGRIFYKICRKFQHYDMLDKFYLVCLCLDLSELYTISCYIKTRKVKLQ